MAKKVVVVGAVAAGPKAAVRVKRLDPDAEVLLIDEDSLISYGGCGIPIMFRATCRMKRIYDQPTFTCSGMSTFLKRRKESAP